MYISLLLLLSTNLRCLLNRWHSIWCQWGRRKRRFLCTRANALAVCTSTAWRWKKSVSSSFCASFVEKGGCVSEYLTRLITKNKKCIPWAYFWSFLSFCQICCIIHIIVGQQTSSRVGQICCIIHIIVGRQANSSVGQCPSHTRRVDQFAWCHGPMDCFCHINSLERQKGRKRLQSIYQQMQLKGNVDWPPNRFQRHYRAKGQNDRKNKRTTITYKVIEISVNILFASQQIGKNFAPHSSDKEGTKHPQK